MKEIAAEIITEIGKLKTKKDHLLIAIDGRCGSGKSTLIKGLLGLIPAGSGQVN